MSRAQKSILSGVTILGVTGIVCKIIGVLFRIPLGRLIGNGGLGSISWSFTPTRCF